MDKNCHKPLNLRLTYLIFGNNRIKVKMKEEFLHYLWKYQLLNISTLKTTQNYLLSIVSPGIYNYDSGPDFLNAKIRIKQQLWAGNIEIHLKSSDWYCHQHEINENYDAVILHVVWEDDVEVFMKNNFPIPTLELKEFVAEGIIDNYKKLTMNRIQNIPCEQQFMSVNPFLIRNWLERLYLNRLERKSIFIKNLLFRNQNDWDAVLFLLLAKNFGLNKNGDVFFRLATSIPFSMVRKLTHDSLQLNALLFGQAGFLEEDNTHDYVIQLKKEYSYLKMKFALKPIHKRQFIFFRMRHANFPTLRLAQFVALYTKRVHFFVEVMKAKSAEDIYQLFCINVNDFWKNHYTFSKESKKSHKKLTKTFVDLITINTVIPLMFCFQQSMHQLDVEKLIAFLESINPEKNSAISVYGNLGFKIENAFQSQALLELKTKYCMRKRCLECVIGNEILKR